MASMKSLKRNRWVIPELVELKYAADRAGVEFREAKRRCSHSNFQYYFQRQLFCIKPIQQVGYVPSPEKLAQLQIETASQLRFWDVERQNACVALDAAKLELDKAVWKYKETKSRLNPIRTR